MQTFKLNLRRREVGKVAKKTLTPQDLRGVVYGHGIDTTPVMGEWQAVSRILEEAGTSHIIELTVDEDQPMNVLLKDTDHDPISNRLRHFDLHAVKKGEKIDVEVPVHLVGEAPAAKLGLVVHQLIDTLEVRTDPSHIPESFDIDISGLAEVNDTIHVSDITLDEHVEIDDGLLEQPIVKVDEVEELVVEDLTAETSAEDVKSEHGGDQEETAEGEEAGGEAEAGSEDAEQS